MRTLFAVTLLRRNTMKFLLLVCGASLVVMGLATPLNIDDMNAELNNMQDMLANLQKENIASLTKRSENDNDDNDDDEEESMEKRSEDDDDSNDDDDDENDGNNDMENELNKRSEDDDSDDDNNEGDQ